MRRQFSYNDLPTRVAVHLPISAFGKIHQYVPGFARDLDAYMEVIVDFLAKPLSHNRNYVLTIEHLVHMCDTTDPENYDIVREYFGKLIADIFKQFETFGLYQESRLHYVYSETKHFKLFVCKRLARV